MHSQVLIYLVWSSEYCLRHITVAQMIVVAFITMSAKYSKHKHNTLPITTDNISTTLMVNVVITS